MRTALQRVLVAVSAALLGSAAMGQGSDNCNTAPAITGTGSFNYDTRSAGPEQEDMANCWIKRDVWFRWTAPQSGEVIFTTCGSNSPAVIAVHTACGGPSLECSTRGNCTFGASISFQANAGSQYLLRVGHGAGTWSGVLGSFNLFYNNPPATNDSCQFALALTGSGQLSFNTSAATSSLADPQGCEMMGRDLWYSFSPNANGTMTVNTCDPATQVDTVLAVFGANACDPAAQYIDCNNNIGWDCNNGLASQLIFNVTAGQTYKLRLGSPENTVGGAGVLKWVFTPQVTNDECTTATSISGPGWFNYHNASATDSVVASDPHNYCGKDVWFRWTATASGPAYITTCGRADMNAFIALFPNECPTGNPIAQNDDNPSCNGEPRVDFQAVAGQQYLIRIGSVWGMSYTTDGQFFIANQEQTQTGGETITVTMTGDHVDFGGFQQVADLPGPDGEVSMREAVAAANNTPGGQTINFACDPMFWTYPMGPQGGRAQIIVDFYPFILTDDGTIIDGASQTAAYGDTDPSGPDVGFFGWQAENTAALYIHGNNCEVRNLNGAGMCGRAIQIYGDNCKVVDCIFLGGLVHNIILDGASNTVIGEPGHGNKLGGHNSGLEINGGSNNRVQSNIINGGFNGVLVRGGAVNTLIGGPTVAERNVVNSVGRRSSEGFPQGTYINIGASTGTIVENNTVALAEDGVTLARGVATTGIGITGAMSAQVRNNTVAGIRVQGTNHYANRVYGTGIYLSGSSDNVVITGNTIGTDVTRTTQYPCLEGFKAYPNYVDGSTPNRALFGGLEDGDANLVVNSERTGVVIGAGSITVSGNSIYNNGLLGIDLLAVVDPIFGAVYGHTPNDSGDGDTGPNELQNFPDVASATSDGSFILVSGTLNSHPSEQFRVEFFGNDACDETGYGEGQRFLGAEIITTDTSGTAAFSARLALTQSAGQYVTGTATRLSTGDTSEFSACVTVGSGSTQLCGTSDFNGDGDSGTDQDIEAFFACIGGHCCPTCYSGGADFNADGDAGTDQDIESFFRVLGGGPC
ncbi:MAG TPA: right-handed parallel beta-helix repeat-containing protein [Phycisphaerales bacterium]|nr:right-handed parallel beta-helix repeat-containing protein [Phycisphaerales bacterium]